jgi:DNA-binding Lrp family transcriptional regulator
MDAKRVLVDLDTVDVKILSEIERDGRLSISDLAKKLGISRASASRRLQRLWDRRLTRTAIFTNPLALGYRNQALTGIQVWPGKLREVCDKLHDFPDVYLILITAGRYDIIIWTMFADPMALTIFLSNELGAISGVKSTDTLMIMEWYFSLSYLSPRHWRKMSFSSPLPPYRATGDHKQRSALQSNGKSDLSIDQLDLMIVKELEKDPRRPISDVARKIGISRATASTRLRRLTDARIVRVTAFANMLALSYHMYVIVGMKVSPKEMNTAVDRIIALPGVFWVVKGVGRYDLVVWAALSEPNDLAAFLSNELGVVPGILAMETMTGLELTKMTGAGLVTTHLRRTEQSLQ